MESSLKVCTACGDRPTPPVLLIGNSETGEKTVVAILMSASTVIVAINAQLLLRQEI